MTAETRVKPRTGLPASKPPAKPKRETRTPHVASTANRDPFEVLGVKPGTDDDIPF